MKEHQANELQRLTVEAIKKWPTTPDGWSPRSNCAFGVSLECVQRQLLKDFNKASEDKRRDEIAEHLTLVGYILGMFLGGRSMGWYCFFCGWLDPKQVTNGERCSICGSLLPIEKLAKTAPEP